MGRGFTAAFGPLFLEMVVVNPCRCPIHFESDPGTCKVCLSGCLPLVTLFCTLAFKDSISNEDFACSFVPGFPTH
ncbi:hypothetical protein IWX48DRAFT_597896 [Phyllosticta citricarpa]